VKIQRAEIHESDCTLDMDDLARKIYAAHETGGRGIRLERCRHQLTTLPKL